MYLSAAAVCAEDAGDAAAATAYIDTALDLAQGLLDVTQSKGSAIAAEVAAATTQLDEMVVALRDIGRCGYSV